MNKVLMSLLFGAFILTGSSYAQTPAPAAAEPAAAPTASAAVATVPSRHHDRYPELHKAIHDLRLAKSNLEKAAHDYDGHKAKAIEAINHALAELQLALDHAKTEK